MASYTPSVHQVFNEFDRHGLLLGLPRLEGEENSLYKQRLLDVMINRASSTYQGLINGITRELGLSITEVIRIVPVTSGGITLLSTPAIVFENTKCYLYTDYSTGTLLATLDRWEISGGVWTIGSLVDYINATGYFIATLLEDADEDSRSMTIFNQSSIGIVPIESIVGSAGRIVLKNKNLINETISVVSPNLNRRVSSEAELASAGDYFVDAVSGTVFATVAPAPGSSIRYKYRNDNFIVRASPIIIHNLQSDDFKTKMFEQILDEDGNSQNGKTTELGADIVNELMSIYAANYGP